MKKELAIRVENFYESLLLFRRCGLKTDGTLKTVAFTHIIRQPSVTARVPGIFLEKMAPDTGRGNEKTLPYNSFHNGLTQTFDPQDLILIKYQGTISGGIFFQVNLYSH